MIPGETEPKVLSAYFLMKPKLGGSTLCDTHTEMFLCIYTAWFCLCHASFLISVVHGSPVDPSVLVYELMGSDCHFFM